MKKDGNKTVKARNALRSAASRPRLRLKTVVALERLHPDPEPSTPPPPAITPVPSAENLTGLYGAMCATEAPPEACALAGVAAGSTWGQCIVASHVRAAVTGDNGSINSIVSRLEGKAPNATMSEEQFLAYLDAAASSPDAPRLRQLVLRRLGCVPNLHVNFVDSRNEVITERADSVNPPASAIQVSAL